MSASAASLRPAPRSRRPASNPCRTPDEVIAAIAHLREQLVADGLDAGPVTLQWHLNQAGLPAPSTSTIRRILHHHGLITPQPRKRPRSSYHRFAAEQPNQCWQSDFTHWTLADGTDTEILNWLDDHARYLLACTAHRRVGGPNVVTSFTTTATQFGLPAATLTDNGSVYTSRFTGGHNDFERLLAALGITQKNGHPGHPQTQGKIERFLVTTNTVTVISKTGYHVLANHDINLDKNYWPNKQKNPGTRPGNL